MASAGDKAQDTIRKAASHARALVDKAGIVVSNGFWKMQKAVRRTGEKVKDAGRKIEDGA